MSFSQGVFAGVGAIYLLLFLTKIYFSGVLSKKVSVEEIFIKYVALVIMFAAIIKYLSIPSLNIKSTTQLFNLCLLAFFFLWNWPIMRKRRVYLKKDSGSVYRLNIRIALAKVFQPHIIASFIGIAITMLSFSTPLKDSGSLVSPKFRISSDFLGVQIASGYFKESTSMKLLQSRIKNVLTDSNEKNWFNPEIFQNQDTNLTIYSLPSFSDMVFANWLLGSNRFVQGYLFSFFDEMLFFCTSFQSAYVLIIVLLITIFRLILNYIVSRISISKDLELFSKIMLPTISIGMALALVSNNLLQNVFESNFMTVVPALFLVKAILSTTNKSVVRFCQELAFFGLMTWLMYPELFVVLLTIVPYAAGVIAEKTFFHRSNGSINHVSKLSTNIFFGFSVLVLTAPTFDYFSRIRIERVSHLQFGGYSAYETTPTFFQWLGLRNIYSNEGVVSRGPLDKTILLSNHNYISIVLLLLLCIVFGKIRHSLGFLGIWIGYVFLSSIAYRYENTYPLWHYSWIFGIVFLILCLDLVLTQYNHHAGKKTKAFDSPNLIQRDVMFTYVQFSKIALVFLLLLMGMQSFIQTNSWSDGFRKTGKVSSLAKLNSDSQLKLATLAKGKDVYFRGIRNPTALFVFAQPTWHSRGRPFNEIAIPPKFNYREQVLYLRALRFEDESSSDCDTLFGPEDDTPPPDLVLQDICVNVLKQPPIWAR